ncbi:GGDEF domain-containing protein [Onishia taeanensis]
MSTLLLLIPLVCAGALVAWWIEHHYRRPLKQLIERIDAFEPLAESPPSPPHRIVEGTLVNRLARRVDHLCAANRQLREQAIKDPLTGLGNRRLLEQRLDIVLPLSRRWMRSVSALMIDVDHFKEYNDLYGHQAGDECLVDIANVLRDTFRRETDIVVRLGGEEFLVVLLDADQAEAERLAEAMRGMLQAVGISHQGSEVANVVTVSIGVAITHSGAPFDLDDMIATADAALYECKETGRNRVISRHVGKRDEAKSNAIA